MASVVVFNGCFVVTVAMAFVAKGFVLEDLRTLHDAVVLRSFVVVRCRCGVTLTATSAAAATIGCCFPLKIALATPLPVEFVLRCCCCSCCDNNLVLFLFSLRVLLNVLFVDVVVVVTAFSL